VATVLDPYQIPAKVLSDKLSIVDVKCKDREGKTYIVEMQLLSKDSFLSRVVYNVSKSYANQLKRGVPYSTLQDVIGVTIVNFELFPEFPDRYISCHEITEKITKTSFMKQLCFYFVELPKFKKTLEELENSIDKWLYFLKYAEGMNEIPGELKEAFIEQAFEIAESARMTDEEGKRYEVLETDYRDRLAELEWAKKEGEKEGEKKGEKIAAEKIAKKMLKKNIDVDTISEMTGLSVEVIKKLSLS
jgi:predicted transposase/invertase (TIGR01784 family)